MTHASAIAESNVAPTLFRHEFLHSLDPKATLRLRGPAKATGWQQMATFTLYVQHEFSEIATSIEIVENVWKGI